MKDTRRDKWGKVLPHHQYQVDNFDYYHSGSLIRMSSFDYLILILANANP